jgi:hypothetical protein
MIRKRLNKRGVTLLEVVVVCGLFLIVMIPVALIYNQSLINLFAVEKVSDSQRNAENGLFFISQELAGAQSFYTINSTQSSASTYRNTAVSFYYQASDSTLRRFRGIGFTNGAVIARYVTNFNLTYIADTTYQPTYTASSVVGVRIEITTNAPASNIVDPTSIDSSGFTVSSYVWCRNRKTN